MKETIIPSHSAPGVRVVPRSLTGMLVTVARKAIFSQLMKIKRGKIVLIDDHERRSFGNDDPAASLCASITVNDPAFYTDLAFGGSIGAAEAYMSGFWSADNLTSLIRIIILNRNVLTGMEGGLARITVPLHWLLHRRRKNTKTASQKNISAHYDLGNDFYALFLDPTMTYSCNVFEREDMTLKEAAIAKYDRICRKIRLGPDDHVLEIGAGWGGFSIHAATVYGCRVTTTTISRQQYEMAKERIERLGLKRRIELLFEDYRNLRGKYDKLVSIEMIEAVGHHFLETYLRRCSNCLKDDGMMALQTITMTDQLYEAHIHSADFIKRYIFPGSFIPSISAISNAVGKATDMKLFHLEDITPHYARTLQLWRQGFLSRIENVRGLGYPESFIRMWEYYLCYCEAGFMERYIGDAQMIFIKPDYRQPSILPGL